VKKSQNHCTLPHIFIPQTQDYTYRYIQKVKKTMNVRKEGKRCGLLFLKENDADALFLLNKVCNSF
jgi:hypothetical protein